MSITKRYHLYTHVHDVGFGGMVRRRLGTGPTVSCALWDFLSPLTAAGLGAPASWVHEHVCQGMVTGNFFVQEETVLKNEASVVLERYEDGGVVYRAVVIEHDAEGVSTVVDIAEHEDPRTLGEFLDQNHLITYFRRGDDYEPNFYARTAEGTVVECRRLDKIREGVIPSDHQMEEGTMRLKPYRKQVSVLFHGPVDSKECRRAVRTFVRRYGGKFSYNSFWVHRWGQWFAPNVVGKAAYVARHVPLDQFGSWREVREMARMAKALEKEAEGLRFVRL